MKLTGRDKGLIIGVIVAIVWLVGILNFIKPNVQKIKEKNVELENKTTELNTLEAQVEEEKNLPQEVEDLKKEAVEIRSLFYSKKKVTEVDEIIKTKFDDAKVEIDGMTINNEAALTLAPYMYAPAEVATDITNAAKIYEITDDSSSTASTNNNKANQTNTLGYTVTVNYSAKKDDLNKFLAELSEKKDDAKVDDNSTADGENANKDVNAASLVVSNLTIADHTADKYTGTMTLTMYCVEELQTEEEAKAEAEAKATDESKTDNASSAT